MRINGRRAITGALLATALLAGGAVRQPQVADLGDVRYSVLDPSHFRAVHGNGWMLMDGGNINGKALCTEHGFCQLPDARGVFIRGMNLGRDKATGDADGDRQVGVRQNDRIAAHQHIYREWRWQVSTGNGPYPDGLTANPGNKPTVNTTGGPDGTETRPRNIALYTYVKVD